MKILTKEEIDIAKKKKGNENYMNLKTETIEKMFEAMDL